MTMDNISIAVVIVNYNGGEYVMQCLEALFAQNHPAYRVVVVDNNSDDGSPGAIRRTFPSVDLLELDANTGFAAANNRGFEHLEDSTWVALLNPDTIPAHDWLEKLAIAVAEKPDFDIFASRLVDARDNEILDGEGDIYHVSGLCWRRHHGLSVHATNLKDDPVFSGCAAAALYRRQRVMEVGGFDENYFCYYEDIDLVFRMRLVGAKCCYVASSEVLHFGSGLTGRDSDFSVYHGHRNMIWTYVKNMPGKLFYMYLPQHILMNLVSLLHYTLKGRWKIIWKSKWHALMGVPRAMKMRKQIQLSRTVESDQLRKHMVTGLLRPYLSRFR